MPNRTKDQVINQFLGELKHTESELLENLAIANKRYSNTTKVIFAVITTISIGLLISLILIMQFAKDVDQIVNSLDGLDQQIVMTQTHTHQISHSLTGITAQTVLMPQLVKSSASISQNISEMNEDFKAIEHNSISMSQSSQVIDTKLKDVGQRLNNVNQSMERIVYNVNQLSKTVP
jgi:methyl-accepting chemotaxis protein